VSEDSGRGSCGLRPFFIQSKGSPGHVSRRGWLFSFYLNRVYIRPPVSRGREQSKGSEICACGQAACRESAQPFRRGGSAKGLPPRRQI